jgi:hypothetical protein
MADHLREHFPVDAALLGDDGLSRVVWAGIDRVCAHGIDVEGDACRYISLSMALGTAFDVDPLLPWASEILARKDSASVRVAMLRKRGLEHLERVSGVDGRRALRAALRVRAIAYEDLCAPGSSSDAQVRERLMAIHPSRCAELEDACSWPVFFSHLDWVATRIGMNTPGPRALCAVYLCLLGGHFVADPQHPWLPASIDAVHTNDPETRARAMLDAGNAWLGRALTLMPRGAV